MVNIDVPEAASLIDVPEAASTIDVPEAASTIDVPEAASLIDVPEAARTIMGRLEEAGFEAFVVGGCVRDSLLGRGPKDWDVCTSALPEQTLEIFKESRVVETGLKHGTVTIMAGDEPIEVTTYRIDGDYSDNRRPDKVEFTASLREDLSRRDFTINAMAYSPAAGLVDYHGGADDLKAGTIRCVGDPGQRFTEDALRIMRALRFSAVLEFSIDAKTKAAMHDNRGLLRNIAAERIAAELNGLILGDGVRKTIAGNLDVVFEVIPELAQGAGFEQNNPYHCYTVLNHILFSVENVRKDVRLRLTMLLHDIAKPKCYTESDSGGHFYGHAQVGADMARVILSRLKYDNATISTVCGLIKYHDATIPSRRRVVKKWLNKIGEARLRQLLEVKTADAKAQVPAHGEEKIAGLEKVLALIDDVIEHGQCFSLKDLAVNGRDLIEAGVPEGPGVGVMLKQLVGLVIDEKVENERAALLGIVKMQLDP